jgi:hypothetical protein
VVALGFLPATPRKNQWTRSRQLERLGRPNREHATLGSLAFAVYEHGPIVVDRARVVPLPA